MSGCKPLEELIAANLPFALDWLPSPSYLVGGAVRDALLCRVKEYLDLDFVVPENAIATAKKIANHYHGGFVVLDEGRSIARVVFPQGTVDFAQMEGQSLEQDLHRRDFTVNAIAYNPYTKTIVDPLQGIEDLQQKSLKMVSLGNLAADPLRLLRAYRQAAQLNFTIAQDTRQAIRKLAALLGKVAAERVQSELNYLLKTSQGQPWLERAWQDGLFLPWLGAIDSDKIAAVAAVEKSAQALRAIFPDFMPSPEELKLAKLSCLVSASPELAEKELMRLKYSRQEIRAVTTVLKTLPDLCNCQDKFSLREQYSFFVKIGKFFPIFAIITTALSPNNCLIIFLLKRYLDPSDPLAHPHLLLTGHDLIAQLNLAPSPTIGKLLTEIQFAQIEGKVTSFSEAINFARQWVLLQENLTSIGAVVDENKN